MCDRRQPLLVSDYCSDNFNGRWIMQTILAWALVIGILFSIIGAGGAFMQLAGGIIAIALVVGGILIIVGISRPGEVLLPLLGAAFALGFVPSLRAGFINSLTWRALFLIGISIIVVALMIGRERQ
jgi:hypothetical protein